MSKESARYDGPSGSIKEGFLRIDSGPKDAKSTGPQSCCQFHKPSELFALERLRLAISGDPSAVVRRSKCDSLKEFVGETISFNRVEQGVR
jgi:hypothetical protein